MGIAVDGVAVVVVEGGKEPSEAATAVACGSATSVSDGNLGGGGKVVG